MDMHSTDRLSKAIIEAYCFEQQIACLRVEPKLLTQSLSNINDRLGLNDLSDQLCILVTVTFIYLHYIFLIEW